MNSRARTIPPVVATPAQEWRLELRLLFAEHEARGEAQFFGVYVIRAAHGSFHLRWRNGLSDCGGHVATIPAAACLTTVADVLAELRQLRSKRTRRRAA